MPKFLHTVAVQDRAVGADGIETFDLAVNPLSMVLLNIRPLNDTGTLAEFQRANGIAKMIRRCSILHRGASVVSARGEDLLALNYFRRGSLPFIANGDDTNNERRCMQLPIYLGKWAYDPHSCFPATKRGELTMELDVDIAATGIDGFRYSVETIEILGATPKEYERTTSVAKTFAATGPNDVDLPNGLLVRGLLLYGTTGFGGASPAPTWGRVELLKDNQQECFAATDWESLRQLGQLMGRQPPTGQAHFHRTTTDGNAQTAVTTLAGPHGEGEQDDWEKYAFMDLDPTRDDMYSVDTAGSSSFLIRSQAEAAEAVRVVQVERVAA